MSDFKYKDIDLSFTNSPLTNDIGILKDENAIKNRLKNELLRNFHERFYDNSQREGIEDLLMEADNIFTRKLLRDSIRTVLFEDDRIDDIKELTITFDEDNNAYDVHLGFTIDYNVARTDDVINIGFILEQVS